MSGLLVFYGICAAATYWFYTRRQPGRQVMGALLWPVVLFGAARHGRDQFAAYTRQAVHTARDKGVVEAPAASADPQAVGAIELPVYGAIDPTE
jgi:hypothetical protein